MTDLALEMIDRGAGVMPGFDIALHNMDLATDEGLQTAVIISLFTDRRAENDDVIPDGTNDRRGWWSDSWPDIEGDLIGSRLWLLHREKELPQVLVRAHEYAEEALQWLIDDGVAQSIHVEAEVVRRGWLGLYITIQRPNKSAVEYRFNHLWEAH